jgi:hypothetical protein
MFISGTIKYSGELVGLVLSETVFPTRAPPVTEVRVRCDGHRAELTVLLGPVESEAVAFPAADAEMLRVWGALLVSLSDLFTTATFPARREAWLDPPPTPGVVGLRGAITVSMTANAFLTVTPSPEQVRQVQELAAAQAWNPSANLVFERYAPALSEPDTASQFLALYATASLAVELMTGLDEPGQKLIDREFWRLEPSLPRLVHPDKGPETPFTRARNQLVHPRDRGVRFEDAKTQAAGELPGLRRAVAKLVAAAPSLRTW